MNNAVTLGLSSAFNLNCFPSHELVESDMFLLFELVDFEFSLLVL